MKKLIIIFVLSLFIGCGSSRLPRVSLDATAPYLDVTIQYCRISVAQANKIKEMVRQLEKSFGLKPNIEVRKNSLKKTK
jgi:uncharacterized protein YxeA